RPRIGANEPPLVPYRFPIIGHTYSFSHDTGNFLKKCKETYGEPFSLYIFGSVRTFTGVDSTHEVLRNSEIFDFYAGANKLLPVGDVFRTFIKNNPTSYIARMVHEQVSGKINIYTSRLQNELLFGIDKFFGDCKGTFSRIIAKPVANVILGEECAQYEDIITSFSVVENELQKMRFVPRTLSFIHPSLHKFFVTLPLKFGWNPISRHRDLFVQRCKPIIEERIRQRKELGEEYIQKEDLLDFFISESEKDVLDNEYMNKIFVVLYQIVFASINYSGRPELWNEIYEEQLKIHNESNGILSTEDVNKMVKLDCFLKESFRYSADPAGLPHTLVSDSYTFSNGTTIPKGRDVYLYMKDTAFNNRFFGETSNDFQPNRHITSYRDGKIIHSPATRVDKSFITFGGGKHACPGRVFAVTEIKMCLHKLILRYKIRTESGKIEPPRVLSLATFPSIAGLIFENHWISLFTSADINIL
ncbi:20496_t:CDS:10, partial [Gigaspora margarita]